MAKRIVVEFAGDTSKLDAAFAKVKSGSSGLEKAVKGLAAGAVFGMVTAQIGDALKASSDLNESLSKSNAVFGASAAAINAWAQQGATDFGLSKRAALDAAAGFGNMFNQLGIATGHAATLSQNIVELAADFASFHNADISQVLDAQSAAFRGEYDSLQRFLPLINAATVEQRAMELTGKANAKALTAQEKALAVNNLMFEGAGKAMGDFDRTAGSAANQQRTLSANIENTKAILGEKLQPVMNQVLSWLNSDGIPGFIRLAEVVGEGFADSAGFFVGAMADIASAVGQTLEKVDQFIPGMEGVPEQLMRGVAEMRRMEAQLHGVNVELEFSTGATADHAAAQRVAAKAIQGTTAATKSAAEKTADLKDAQLSARSAALSVEDAQANLSRAQAKLNELTATGGINAEKLKSAQEDLARANKDVESATKGVAEAQEAVNEALKPPTQRQIGKAARDVAAAQDAVTAAQLDLTAAGDELIRVTNDATATDAERKQAWLDRNSAIRALQDAEENLTDVQQTQNDLQKVGTTDSAAYKSAIEVLTGKQADLRKATDDAKLAQDAVNDAQKVGKGYADDLRDAQREVANAVLDLDKKSWDAEKAQIALKDAQKGTTTETRNLWGNVIGLKDELKPSWEVDPALNPKVAGPVLPGQLRAPPITTIGRGAGGSWAPRAAGGPVRAGAGYLVGEEGPELFVPSRGGTVVPNGAGGVTIVVNGWVGNDVELTRKIMDALVREQKLSGIRGFG